MSILDELRMRLLSLEKKMDVIETRLSSITINATGIKDTKDTKFLKLVISALQEELEAKVLEAEQSDQEYQEIIKHLSAQLNRHISLNTKLKEELKTFGVTTT